MDINVVIIRGWLLYLLSSSSLVLIFIVLHLVLTVVVVLDIVIIILLTMNDRCECQQIIIIYFFHKQLNADDTHQQEGHVVRIIGISYIKLTRSMLGTDAGNTARY